MLLLSHLYKSSILLWFSIKDLSSWNTDTISIMSNLRSFTFIGSTDETVDSCSSVSSAALPGCCFVDHRSARITHWSTTRSGSVGKRTDTQTPIPFIFSTQKTHKNSKWCHRQEKTTLRILTKCKPTINRQNESKTKQFWSFCTQNYFKEKADKRATQSHPEFLHK